MLINMSKVDYFLYFLLMTAQNQPLVGQEYFSRSERSYLALRENAMYGPLVFELPLVRCQPLIRLDFGIFGWLRSVFDTATFNISQTVTPNPINHTIYWKTQQDLSGTLIYFAQTETNFLLPSIGKTENEPFSTF